MATRVYNEEEISLQSGDDVVLKPLVVGRLRRFMDAWAKFADVKKDDEGFNVFINCAGIALEENFKGKFDALKATPAEKEKGEYLSPEYKEFLEDTLDLESIYRILDIAGGIKLNDPKMIEAALAAAQESPGTN